MSLPVELLPSAQQDLIDGQTWFDGRRPGLGQEFVIDVLDRLEQIGSMPGLYGEVASGIRGAGVKRFGYVIYYRVLPDVVEVLAILHGSRDPRGWQSRI